VQVSPLPESGDVGTLESIVQLWEGEYRSSRVCGGMKVQVSLLHESRNGIVREAIA
jgi:hypothetical protein